MFVYGKQIGLVCLLSGALALSTQAAELGTFEEAGWEGTAFGADGTGEFTGCVISAPYRSGAVLLFVVDANYQFSVGLGHPSWLFSEGERVFAVMKIDRADPFSGTGTAIANSQLNFPFESTESNYNLFRYGRMLTVHFDGKTFEFMLDGTARALAKLLTCVDVYSGRLTAEASPPESASSDDRLAQRVEAMEIATNVISAAGLSGFRIISDQSVREEMDSPDVLWTADGLIGTANVIDFAGDFSIDEVAAIRGSMGTGCEGGRNTAVKRETVNGRAVANILTECVGSQGDTVVITKVIAARPAGGYFEFSFAGVGSSLGSEDEGTNTDQGEDIRNAALITITQ